MPKPSRRHILQSLGTLGAAAALPMHDAAAATPGSASDFADQPLRGDPDQNPFLRAGSGGMDGELLPPEPLPDRLPADDGQDPHRRRTRGDLQRDDAESGADPREAQKHGGAVALGVSARRQPAGSSGGGLRPDRPGGGAAGIAPVRHQPEGAHRSDVVEPVLPARSDGGGGPARREGGVQGPQGEGAPVGGPDCAGRGYLLGGWQRFPHLGGRQRLVGLGRPGRSISAKASPS